MTLPMPRPTAAVAAALAVAALAAPLGAPSAAAPAAAIPAAVDVRRDVQYGMANGKPLLLDAYVPAPVPGGQPAVVMIHGGGWRMGDKASWEEEARRFAEQGWPAFSVNYRLDEPSAFPAEVDDVQSAVRWVRAHAAEYGVDPRRIAALGESAGGHLAAMLATLGQGPLDGDARIRVGAAWSPPVDLTALARSRGDGWAGSLLGCTASTCPDRLAEASPVTHVDSTDAPLYLINSTDELVPLSQAEAMAARLRAAGVDHRLDVLPGARHAMDFRRDAWVPTVAFLERHLVVPAPSRPPSSSSSSTGNLAYAGGAAALLGVGGALLLRRRRSREGAGRPEG